MNSEPQNFSSNSQSSTPSDFEQIEDLIELLLEQQTAVDNSSQDSPLAENEAANSTDAKLDDAEIKVEIQSELKPTLKEAVEYKAFMRQTMESKAPEVKSEVKSKSEIASLNSIEQIEAIAPETASSEDLVDLVNALIPLIVELLHFKLEDAQEGVIRTVRPVLDRLIEERTIEDSPKMAAAIAKILPFAIESEIKRNPEAIAKAIAPEIALSIREQILLDRDAIPQTLGPEMGKAIKAQIESEKDAMVDALYPVIGSTIAKYMVEVVQDINSKVESTLSLEGIKRKIRAKLQGVSEAELIFKESVGYRVRAIFLIDKDSGLVIQEIQLPGEKQLDSDMLAGMLTAIRSFANDCISSGSELNSIDYGDWQIPLEVAGYCYLAVVVAGEPPKELITKIRQVLGEIVMEHDQVIQNFDGNLAKVPIDIRNKLEQLTEANQDQPKSSSSPVLLWLIIFILSIIFIPWGINKYRAKVAHNIEQTIAAQLDAAPELSIYRLDSQVDNGQVIVQGRVPSEYLRDRAAVITQEIANQYNLKLNNQIVTVDVPVNPTLVTGEIKRLTNLFNQQSQVAIKTDYSPKTLTITGFTLDPATRQNINRAFRQIPGVEQIVFELDSRLPIVEQRIYFSSGSSRLNFADNSSKINAVEQLLRQYPQLHLKLTGHSDGIGSNQINQSLSQKRCQSVKAALVSKGIDSFRLVDDCDLLPSLPNTANSSDLLSNRYVSVKLFIPPNASQ
jgi:outer membrane protein OmpA-like peptidoglycan-associated protein